MKNKFKKGNVSTEVIIGIALSVVVLFVMMGLFSDNLSKMISSSNIKNIFTGDRTTFSSFNPDYTSSQVDVQLVGEQGLEMLRRIANNKALGLIDASFNDQNQNVGEIAYLGLMIEAMVGQPDICVYMKKNSLQHCNEDSIGGYDYKLEIAGNSLTINQVNESGTSVIKTVNLTYTDTAVGALLTGTNLSVASGGRSTLSEDETYSFMANISEMIKNHINSDVILINKTKTFKNTKIANSNMLPVLIPRLKSLMSALQLSIYNAHNTCRDYWYLKGDMDYSNGEPGCAPETTHGNNFVDLAEISLFNSMTNNMINSLSSYTGTTSSGAINLIIKNSYTPSLIEILKNDSVNSPSSCEIFKNGLQSIATEYKLNFDIPECVPNGT